MIRLEPTSDQRSQTLSMSPGSEGTDSMIIDDTDIELTVAELRQAIVDWAADCSDPDACSDPATPHYLYALADAIRTLPPAAAAVWSEAVDAERRTLPICLDLLAAAACDHPATAATRISDIAATLAATHIAN